MIEETRQGKESIRRARRKTGVEDSLYLKIYKNSKRERSRIRTDA
jgi:hypothetical protein